MTFVHQCSCFYSCHNETLFPIKRRNCCISYYSAATEFSYMLLETKKHALCTQIKTFRCGGDKTEVAGNNITHSRFVSCLHLVSVFITFFFCSILNSPVADLPSCPSLVCKFKYRLSGYRLHTIFYVNLVLAWINKCISIPFLSKCSLSHSKFRFIFFVFLSNCYKLFSVIFGFVVCYFNFVLSSSSECSSLYLYYV